MLSSGVRPDYVSRLLEELSQHRQSLIDDIVSEGLEPPRADAEADRRMGSPQMLAQAALAGLRIGTFTGRHPHLAFVVAPLFLLPLCWCACFLSAAWLASAVSGAPDAPSTDARAILLGGCYVCGYALPALLSALFYLHARRRLCQTGWAFLPCALLSAIAGYTFFRFGFSPDHLGPGSFVAGIAASPDPLKLVLALGAVSLLEMRHVLKVQQHLRAVQ
ncbi:MAG TPA: hypothetical protein VGQ99_04685 [Tepidisphaeraceae bacterium]|nr:hypothetical protein [Tepidisphaeraceae bacterium]